MTVPAISSRKTLLSRGWWVATEIELAFMGLSGRAHDLLIILKHLQGDNPDADPSRERLAEMLGTSVRTVQNALNELRRKGAINSLRTGRSSRHTATYVHATQDELRMLLGAEVQIPADLLETPRSAGSCTSEVQDPGSSPLYKELPKNNNYNPSLREGSGAAQEATMSRRGTTPQHVIVDEFDPVAALGSQSSQELADGLPDAPDGLFPAPEAQSPSSGRQRPARTQVQLDAPMVLAMQLEKAIQQANWDGGPAPVNRAALARNLSAWKHGGTTADQIRAMITQYVGDTHLRSPHKTPWIDFVNKRHMLLNAVARITVNLSVEEHRDADESYWLGSMAGGQ